MVTSPFFFFFFLSFVHFGFPVVFLSIPVVLDCLFCGPLFPFSLLPLHMYLCLSSIFQRFSMARFFFFLLLSVVLFACAERMHIMTLCQFLFDVARRQCLGLIFTP